MWAVNGWAPVPPVSQGFCADDETDVRTATALDEEHLSSGAHEKSVALARFEAAHGRRQHLCIIIAMRLPLVCAFICPAASA
jgi:hypothetical protein